MHAKYLNCGLILVEGGGVKGLSLNFSHILAQITTFLLSGARGRREALLKRSWRRNNEQIRVGESERGRKKAEVQWARGKKRKHGGGGLKRARDFLQRTRTVWKKNKLRHAHFNLK